MKMIVAKAFRPKGSNSPEVKVDSEIELTESQARVFKAVGFVKDPSAQPAPPAPAAAVKTVQAAPVAAKKTPRTYLRRDMTAQPAAPAQTGALQAESTTPPADE
jgi:hypothetical protein